MAAKPQPEISFTAIDSPALQFLPRQQEAQGWRLEADPIVVPSPRLETYLEQGASEFAPYSVIDMTAGNYVATNGTGFASVEIFRFPDFVKAFGAYSQRKEGPIQYINVLNEAFVAKHSVHLWRGPFYVRVTGSSSDGMQSLVRLTSFVADRMPAAPGKPAVLSFLPVSNRVPNSECYAASQGLGQRFLGNSFQARFNVDGAEVTGLIIPAADKTIAARILDAYRLLYIRNGKLMDPVEQLGEDNFTAEDRYLGRTVAFRIDRFVVVFNGYNERQKLIDLASATDQRILGSIRKQLVQADKADDDTTRGSKQPAWMQRH